MSYTLISSQPIYHGRAVSLRVDHVRLPDGQTADWEVVEHPGAVTLVPVDNEGRIWFVRQYRHSIARELLELPAGTLEPGEDPLLCASRELQEEIGMAAGRLQKLGNFYLAPGYSQEYMHLYMAADLTPSALPMDPDESMTVVPVPASEALHMAHDGRISDAKSLAALLLAAPHLPA